MAVTANELIPAVIDAEQRANNEADFRAVCSRSYYAIFQDGDGFHSSLPSHGIVPPSVNGGMHAKLIQQLINPSVSRSSPLFFKSMSIGYLMQSLYAKRIKADYDRSLDIDKPTATAALAEAMKILATIQNALPPTATAAAPSPAQQAAAVTAPAPITKPSLTRIK